MKSTIIITAVLGLSSGLSHAQITDLGTMSSPQVIKTMPTAGLKIMEGLPPVGTAPTGFILRNLDLSVYQTINYPAIPGYEFRSTTPDLVSESLFDTDPSTIEYVVHLHEPGSYALNTAVIRADGTVLFIAELQWLNQLGSEPIFNTPLGTRMILLGWSDGMGSDPPTHLYALPGSLPCLDCDGTVSALGMMLGSEEETHTDAGIRAFPNPAVSEATISCTLPEGTGHATLVLSTLGGSIVSRMAITNSGTKTITTADLAAGTYLYHVETDQGMIGAKRLVVVK